MMSALFCCARALAKNARILAKIFTDFPTLSELQHRYLGYYLRISK